MEKTPYAYDFLWNQIELGYREIRKPVYKELVNRYLYDSDIRQKVEKLKDKTGRNYEGGFLEKTASLVSLSLCMYDNYPEINIDLLLAGIILNFLCRAFPKKECFEQLKDYPEIIPFLFKKKRTKPTVELTIYEGLQRLDNRIIMRLRRERGEKKKR